MAGWRRVAPEGFVFACKASRYITHMKKLKDPRASTRKFFDATAGFGDTLGPVLFQLPPRWSVNPERLAVFLAALPPGRRYAFEFRDESWFTPAVMDLLAQHDVAFCIYDLAGRTAPLEVTTDFVYLRLHGPKDAYGGSYGRRALARWGARIAGWTAAGADVWCYFDNDEEGYAVANAAALKEIVAEHRGG